MTSNRRVVLAARPRGMPAASDFRLECEDVPTPSTGQVLLRTLYLSLDPYMRGRMSDTPSYAQPVGVDEVVCGQTVSRVEASCAPQWSAGDLVLADAGWQEYSLASGDELVGIPADLPAPTHALGVMGMPGFTAWYGLSEIGAPQPGETVVVGAASGAVGSVVGQIAKIRGARVVGIAGGESKCELVVDRLGFDACVDHRDPDFPIRLQQACPGGVDVYFESIGGAVFDAVLPLLNARARVPLCGLIASYNEGPADAEPGTARDRLPALVRALLVKRIRMEGFIISDHFGDHFAAFARDMAGWLREGRIVVLEDVVEGLENAPAAFIGMLRGVNRGKLVIDVGALDT